MEKLTYRVIKSERQYYDYCNQLEELVTLKKKTRDQEDIIELLTLLIEKWDEEHNPLEGADPIELLRYLMNENKMKSVDLAKMLDISSSLVSDILNYRRGLSKEVIRKLADRFKVSQELFNRSYPLISAVTTAPKNGRVTAPLKKLKKAG